ncbi:hypothetical protein ANCCAN_04290 [Ancylostoma caninum]|uniref:Uncharacterized protein n=1 Tax=Ancylostoma caninum TaxID=29170 RepID=A0A368GZ89_ANCCA|nr:hypothetical protein ANCCAN_04290 [Ancylostoma caninum]
MNLNKLLQNWQRPRRARSEDHMTHCVDLMRTYFMRACDPPAAVRTYVCRLTGMNAKDEKLINLPEELVSVLVDFLLEGLGIGQPELEATIESLKLAPTESAVLWISPPLTSETVSVA